MLLTTRHYVPGRDDEVRADLYNRAHAEDEDFVPSTTEDVRRWGKSPHWMYFNDFIALLDGVPSGLISVRVHARRTDRVGSIDGPHVPPELRRRGIGTALVLAALADLDAQGQVAAHARAPDTTEASDFLTSLGFKPVRRFSRMERPLTGLPQNVGESAEATITRPELTPDMIRILVDLENETFKEHFNRPPETVEGFTFAERNLAAQGITCYISVASVQGTPVGFLTYGYDPREIARLGRNHAGLWDVGVLKPWRNRGVAKALMLSAMKHLHAEGMTEVDLGVDETNVAGALHLYEELGFRVTSRRLAYRKDL